MFVAKRSSVHSRVLVLSLVTMVSVCGSDDEFSNGNDVGGVRPASRNARGRVWTRASIETIAESAHRAKSIMQTLGRLLE